jgi:hypothetical protein
MFSPRRVLRAYAVLFLFAVCVLNAQSTAGRVSGTVSDASSGAVPDVRVTATNNETSQMVNATTNVQGQFVLYPLPPGIYNIRFQKTGFNSLELAQLKISVSESVVRNVSLEVGAITQSVSVAAEAAPIETDSPSIQSTISRQQIEELPLNGRDFNQLVLLAAGRCGQQCGRWDRLRRGGAERQPDVRQQLPAGRNAEQ